jgi:hypothetical protein
MIQRCYNPKNKRYDDYGGRGITVCDQWLDNNGFDNFALWSNNNGFNDNLSIDRIDNDNIYSPENCRWINNKEQAFNRRNNYKIIFDNKEILLIELLKSLNKEDDYYTIKNRIQYELWAVEDAINIPINMTKDIYRMYIALKNEFRDKPKEYFISKKYFKDKYYFTKEVFKRIIKNNIIIQTLNELNIINEQYSLKKG